MAKRWTITLDDDVTEKIEKLCAPTRGKPATWCREAVMQRLQREKTDAKPFSKKRG